MYNCFRNVENYVPVYHCQRNVVNSLYNLHVYKTAKNLGSITKWGVYSDWNDHTPFVMLWGCHFLSVYSSITTEWN